MKKYLILFVLALSAGCIEKEVEPIPSSVFSIERMTDIMVDIQLIEGGIVIRRYGKTVHADRIVEVYKALFKKHGINKQDLDFSMHYYTDHPKRLEEVYDRILERLSELEAEVANEKPDSLQVVQ